MMNKPLSANLFSHGDEIVLKGIWRNWDTERPNVVEVQSGFNTLFVTPHHYALTCRRGKESRQIPWHNCSGPKD